MKLTVVPVEPTKEMIRAFESDGGKFRWVAWAALSAAAPALPPDVQEAVELAKRMPDHPVAAALLKVVGQ